jgi:hypothetical protein
MKVPGTFTQRGRFPRTLPAHEPSLVFSIGVDKRTKKGLLSDGWVSLTELPVRRLAMIRGVRVLAASLVLVAASGCALFEQSDDFRPIEGTIIFSVCHASEVHGYSDEDGLFLGMCTEKIYGCCNWSIVHKSEVRKDQVSIELLGIYAPDICLTALGPAGSHVLLDLSPGEYALQFICGCLTDLYTLSVTDTSFAVTERHASFTRVRSG